MTDLTKIGDKLVEYSSKIQLQPLSKTTELFPSICKASQTMSVRQIANFLNQNDVSIGSATVARALKNKEKHINELACFFEAAILKIAHSSENFTTNMNQYFIIPHEEYDTQKILPPIEELCHERNIFEEKDFELQNLAEQIRDVWFSCSPEIAKLIRLKMFEGDDYFHGGEIPFEHFTDREDI